MGRYLIIIARDRPDLLGRLAVIYRPKGEVEIHFDRRHGQAWTGRGDPPTVAPYRTVIPTSESRVFW